MYIDDPSLPAQLIGLFFIITSFSMAFRRKMMMVVFRDVFRSQALSYILGLLLLILGLFLALMHGYWEGTTSIVIDILAWYLLIESVLYLFLPRKLTWKLFSWLEYTKVYYTVAVGYLILGGYLLYAGFFIIK